MLFFYICITNISKLITFHIHRIGVIGFSVDNWQFGTLGYITFILGLNQRHFVDYVYRGTGWCIILGVAIDC